MSRAKKDRWKPDGRFRETITERKLLSRNWVRLKPSQVSQFSNDPDRLAQKVLGSQIYEVHRLGPDLWIRKL